MSKNSDVIIPPVPSSRKHNLDKSLLEINQLPGFNEYEATKSTTQATAEAASQSSTKTVSHRTVSHSAASHEDHDFTITHKIIRASCLIALIVWFFIIILLSIMTESDPFFTLLGLSPVLLTIIVSYILVDRYHLESGFLMVFPFIFTGVLLMLGFAKLLGGMDFMTLATVNIIFGVIFVAAITVHHGVIKQKGVSEKKEEVVEKVEKIENAVKVEKVEQKAVEKKLNIKLENEEDVKKFVSSIEDKAKALNAVIGRVYSIRHGGTEPMRKKIRIDSSQYNEFNELKDKTPGKRKVAAVKILRKIKESLSVFEQQEKALFSKDEMSDLVRLKRNAQGFDKVLDVLMKNDSDPVKSYYEGAREFCTEALKELE